MVRRSPRRLIAPALTVALGLGLSACGGGSGTSVSPIPSPPLSTPTNSGSSVAYVANRDRGSVSAYLVDAVTGGFQPIASYPVPNPVGVISDPDRRFLYVSTRTSDAQVEVFAYAIDHTGRLTPVGTFRGGNNQNQTPGDMAASSQFLFMTTLATSTGHVNHTWAYQIDSAGSLRSMGPFFEVADPTTLEIHPSGQYLYLGLWRKYGNPSTLRAFRVATTGTVAEIARIELEQDPGPGEVDPLGHFLWIGDTFRDGVLSVFDLRVPDGVPLAIQSLSVDTLALAADPSGRVLLAAASAAGSSQVASFSIDRTTGRLTLRGTLSLPVRFPRTMKVDPSGAFLYVSTCCDSSSPGDDGEVRAIAIDASTGLLRELGPVAAGGDAGLTVIRLP